MSQAYSRYAGQPCHSCGQEIPLVNIHSLDKGLSTGDLMVQCTCPHCGAENEVLLKSLNALPEEDSSGTV